MSPGLRVSFPQQQGMGLSFHFAQENPAAPLRMLLTSLRSLSNLEPRAWVQPLSETQSSFWPSLSRPRASVGPCLWSTAKGSGDSTLQAQQQAAKAPTHNQKEQPLSSSSCKEASSKKRLL